MQTSAHKDTFARDNLPASVDWPTFIGLEQLNYPARINAAHVFLDKVVEDGDGNQPCVISDSVRWTYADLQKVVDRIAHVLVNECEIVAGERILLRAANNPMLVACWFAVIKVGAIAVSTMPLLREKELTVIASKAQTRLALCDERLLDELQGVQANTMLARTLIFSADGKGESQLDQMMVQYNDAFTAVDTAADDVCLIAFTSGTTGQPKGTMHFHRDLLAICDTFATRVLKNTADDVFIGSPPLAFTFGLGGLVLFPMHHRSSLVLIENPSPPSLRKAIETFKPTVLFTSPTAYRALLNIDGINLQSLQKCVSAGETLPLPTYEAWLERTGIKLIDGLGSTEMLHIFITSADDTVRPGATGIPLPLFEACVLGDDNQPVADGIAGRLAVRGPTGCRYLNDPRQKEYVINGWNVTGDTYIRDSDGYYWFQARADDMIISSGYNIAGPEVEDCLLGHPAVADCAVVASPDEQRGHIVKAFIVTHEQPDDPVALSKVLQDFAKRAIAPYKYPRAIEFVTDLPRTETGKVQRFKLRQRELERASKD